MLKFAQSQQSKKDLFIVVAAGLFLAIVVWLCSGSFRRLKDEAEKTPLSLAHYAAEMSGLYNSEMVCKVAVAFAEAGDFNRAQSIINNVEETDYFTFYSFRRFHFFKQLDFNMKDKTMALVEVAGLYARTGRKDNALEVLSQALQIVERIEKVYTGELLVEISSIYVELGEDSQALKVIESDKPELFIKPERLSSFRHRLLLKLSEKYLEVGRVDQALGILERARQTIDNIKDTSLKSIALAETGVVFSKAGQNHKASELLSKAIEVITMAGSQSEQNKSMALTSVAEVYAESGFCRQAYEVTNSITDVDNRSHAQRQVAAICSKGTNTETFTYITQEVEAALKLIETGEHKKGWFAIKNIGRNYLSSGELVDAATRLAQDGKYDLALEVTRAIVSDYLIIDHGPSVPSQELRAKAVGQIALLYARSGRKDDGETRKFLRELLILID